MGNRRRLADEVVRQFGRLFSEEAGIRLDAAGAAPLFEWLVAAVLFSARIRHGTASAAARALFERGWTSAKDMAAASWRERTDVLNAAGYARYDESTSRYLGETAAHLVALYDGDLANLRAAAGRRPDEERRLIKQCKGIGEVGADIFFREAQCVWPELYPFADRKALKAAAKLGLPTDAEGLAPLVGREDFPRLLSGLVRIDLEKAYDRIVQRPG